MPVLLTDLNIQGKDFQCTGSSVAIVIVIVLAVLVMSIACKIFAVIDKYMHQNQAQLTLYFSAN